MFLAETSSTTGGMDSLLQPTGPLKKAQEMAAEAYGSLRTFFVTNGTSTANKIVLQALVAPGDLVLIADPILALVSSSLSILSSFHRSSRSWPML